MQFTAACKRYTNNIKNIKKIETTLQKNFDNLKLKTLITSVY